MHIQPAAWVLLVLLPQVEESKPYVKQYGEERLPKYMKVGACSISSSNTDRQ
jgi:hypothetical protein